MTAIPQAPGPVTEPPPDEAPTTPAAGYDGTRQVLLGRQREQEAIEKAVADGSAGRGGVLVLRGPAGIGKTALLEHAASAAGSMSAIRVQGVGDEQDIPFATLQWVLRAAPQRLERLPHDQASALQAVGRADADLAQDTSVRLATSSLLADMANDGPVLLLVDDAHWIDGASADALSFAARRLEGTAVAMVFAARDSEPTFSPAGLPELELDGLQTDWAGGLLDQHHGDLAPSVRRSVLHEAAGNPLALLELPATLTPAQRAGRVGPGPPIGTQPLRSRVQDEFGVLIRSLPATVQDLLLLTAVEDTGDLALVLNAAAKLDVSLQDVEVAEDQRLLEVNDTVLRFVHPLARAAAYRTAPRTRRMEVHRALAEAYDRDPDRSAWHRSAAATGPDPSVAADLHHVAERAARRRRHVTASAAYERAAQLTTDPHERAERLAAAAEAAALAGLPRRASDLVDQARPLAADDSSLSDRLLLVGAALHDPPGDHRARYRTFVQTAASLSGRTPAAATTLLVGAIHQAWYVGDPVLADSAAEQTRPLETWGDATEVRLASTLARLIGGDAATALPALRSQLDTQPPSDHDGPYLEDLAILTAGTSTRRAEPPPALDHPGGATPGAALGTSYLRAVLALLAGRFRDSAAHAEAAMALLAEDGRAEPGSCCAWHRTDRSHWLSRAGCVIAWLAAVEGAEDRCRSLADGSFELTGSPLLSPATAVGTWALALLDLGAGRYEPAVDRLDELSTGPARHLMVSFHALPDQVEAATRAGQPDLARQALARFETFAPHSAHPWAPAVAARCRALTSLDSDAAEQHFLAALRGHERSDQPYQLARTRLTYGEWLRRALRRREARTHLQAAQEIFGRLGAKPWARRAQNELRAAGYVTRTSQDRPATELLDRLTPQELQVVQQAAAGASNRDIAARLYLSPRTVGYHLYKAFPKLNVTSRRELAQLFDGVAPFDDEAPDTAGDHGPPTHD